MNRCAHTHWNAILTTHKEIQKNRIWENGTKMVYQSQHCEIKLDLANFFWASRCYVSFHAWFAFFVHTNQNPFFTDPSCSCTVNPQTHTYTHATRMSRVYKQSPHLHFMIFIWRNHACSLQNAPPITMHTEPTHTDAHTNNPHALYIQGIAPSSCHDTHINDSWLLIVTNFVSSKNHELYHLNVTNWSM